MIYEKFHHLHDEPTTPVLGAPLTIAETKPSIVEETSPALFASVAPDAAAAFGFQTNPLFKEISDE